MLLPSVLFEASGNSMTWGVACVAAVFIGGVSVGGGDDTTALRRQGRLKKLLEEAGAVE